MYFLFKATPEERAILDPDGNGIACDSTADFGTAPTAAQYADETDGTQQYQYADEADGGDGEEPGDVQYEDGEEPGQDNLCAGAIENVGGDYFPEDRVSFFPDAGGCTLIGASPINPPVLQFNAIAYDPDTGEELGIVKDLDPDLTSGANSTTYQEFCGAFPTFFGEAEELTALEYFEQEANAKEQAILDPDGDGLACTSNDEAFLAGDTGAGDETGNQFEQTWTGQITQTGQDGTVSDEFGVEADIIPVSDMTEGLVGEVVGEVTYDSSDCSGVWVLQEVYEDSVQVQEQIEEGVSNCIEFVPITLTPQEDGSLEYYYFLDTYGSVGEGVLTRQGSSTPDGGIDGQQPEDTEPDQDVPGNRETGGGDSGGWLGGGGGDGIDVVTERVSESTTYIVYGIDDAVIYCGGTVAETARDLGRGRLPDTGGGWTVLLLCGTALVGGGWFLVRRFSR